MNGIFLCIKTSLYTNLASFQLIADTSDDTLIYSSHKDYKLNDVYNVDSCTSLQEHEYNLLDLYNDSDYRKPFHTTGTQIGEVQGVCIGFLDLDHTNFQYRP